MPASYVSLAQEDNLGSTVLSMLHHSATHSVQMQDTVQSRSRSRSYPQERWMRGRSRNRAQASAAASKMKGHKSSRMPGAAVLDG